VNVSGYSVAGAPQLSLICSNFGELAFLSPEPQPTEIQLHFEDVTLRRS